MRKHEAADGSCGACRRIRWEIHGGEGRGVDAALYFEDRETGGGLEKIGKRVRALGRGGGKDVERNRWHADGIDEICSSGRCEI